MKISCKSRVVVGVKLIFSCFLMFRIQEKTPESMQMTFQRRDLREAEILVRPFAQNMNILILNAVHLGNDIAAFIVNQDCHEGNVFGKHARTRRKTHIATTLASVNFAICEVFWPSEQPHMWIHTTGIVKVLVSPQQLPHIHTKLQFRNMF